MTRMLRRRLGSGLRLYGAWLWEAGIHDYTAPMSATGQIKEKRGKQQKSLSNHNQLGSYTCDLYVFVITVVKVPLSLISRFLLDW